VSETTRRSTSAAEDAATQELHRPTPRMPRPLDPAAEPASSKTEVMSIHDLLDGTEDQPALTPLPSPAAAVPVPATADGPTASAPARSELRQRLHRDAAAAWETTQRELRDWLGRGDNALIVATSAAALLLLVVLAAVS
jgi:hypothetical protein